MERKLITKTAFNFNIGKIPPQAIEFEKAILGAIMLERGAYDIASELLKPESFYSNAHQLIFQAFQNLDSNQQPIDLLTTVETLRLTGELENVGGPYYVSQLTNDVSSSANIHIHARIVLEKYILREMIRLSSETLNAAYECESDFHEVLSQHEKTLTLITTGNLKSNFKDTKAIGAKQIDRLYHLQKEPTSLIGVDTGFAVLNQITGGWQDTDLIILAGRPSVGKTALAINFALNASKSVPVGIFSLEMSDDQLMRRMLCVRSRVYLDKLNNGKMSKEELESIVISNDGIKNIFIDDTGGINIYELRSKARRMISKHGVKLIIIDYLQLMSGTGEKNQNREQEISTISRSLKALAKELRVPIIALSQMNRESEKVKREPLLADLRESGAIEQDADMVIFGWREDYQVVDEGEQTNRATLKIAKHRNGALEKLAFYTDMRVQSWFDHIGWSRYQEECKV